MKKRSNSLGLKEKIFLFTMIPFVLVLLIISVLTIQNKIEYERELNTNSIESYVNLLESGDLSFETIEEKEWLETHFNEEVLLAELIKRDRSIVYSTSTSEHKIDEEILDKVFKGYIVTYTEIDEIPVHISIYPVIVKNIVVGAFHVQLSFEQSNNRIKEYTLFVLLLNLSGLILLFLMIHFLSRKFVLNPVEELTKVSSEIRKGNLKYRAEVKSDDELGILASTFNDMTEKLMERNDELKKEKNKVVEKFKELEKEIIHRKKAEKVLRESEEKVRTLYDSSSDAIMLLDENGFFDCNDATLRLFGCANRKEFFSKHPADLSPPTQPNGIDSMTYAKKNIEFALKYGSKRFEHLHRRLDGTEFYADVLLNAMTLGDRKVLQARVNDITDLKKAKKKIEKSLKEKEVLLREIHHRVKNNLQVVSSMLNMQARIIKDKNMIDVLFESRNRINAMALIHAQLYESKSMSEINMKRFIERLMTQLFQSYTLKDIKISKTVHVIDYPFPISIAMPIGLTINELLTNTFKYAFEGRKKGKINVALTASKKGKITITVSDDGVGLPKGFDIYKGKTLGLRLVTILVEDQLQGELKISSKKGEGTTFKIMFEMENA
ncbi:MAG: histidine kinase dimerization/phosphoacceptor domain -containing protein [archaeon]|nr:histidine kinase dimerization/phosphoacceptor domain -containing protein [archaeon]